MLNRKLWKRWVIGSLLVSMSCIGIVGCGNAQSEEEAVEIEVGSDETANAKLSLLETVQRLQSSPYTDTSLTDLCYGLSDPGNVGVVEEEFQDTLYPIPSDEEFDGEIIYWTEYAYKGDNLSKMKAILKEVAENNKKGIKVKLNMPENQVINMDTSKGDSYAFAIVQKGLDGFYLQGNGCTINIQHQKLDYRGFFYFEDGGDIHFENLTIDYEMNPTVTGIIESYNMDKLSVTMKVVPECNQWVEHLMETEGTIYDYIEYNKANRIPKDDGTYVIDSSLANGMFAGYSVSGNRNSGYRMTVFFNPQAETYIKANGVGDYAGVLFSGYVFNTLNFYDCGNIWLEHVTLHCSPSMGIVGYWNKNMYINGLRITLKEDSEQCITTGADGVHILQNSGDVQITNSLIENTYDDAINLKSGYWYDLTSYDVLEGTLTLTRTTESVKLPKVGEVMEIYDRESFEKKASFTVENVSGSEMTYKIKVQEDLTGFDLENWINCAVANDSSADFVFKNNIIQNKRNRGIIMMADNAVIENNTFQNIAHGGVFAWGVLDQYNECGIAGDTTFKNNKFININYEQTASVGDIYVQAVAATYGPSGTIQNIDVENNLFAKSGATSVALTSVENGTIKNNLYYHPSRAYESSEAVINLFNADKITVEGNYCHILESPDLKAVYPGGTTDITTLALNNNTGLELNDGSGVSAGQKIQVAALGDHSITIDGDLSDWSVGTDIDIVGATTEDERNAEESWYADNFKVKTAKLGYNERGIYMGFDLYDNELLFKGTEDFWYGDCVELFMTASNEMQNADMKLYRNLHDTFQMVCVPTWDKGYYLVEERTSDSILEKNDQFKVKVVKTSEGYCGEIFIPFEVVPEVKEAIDNGQGITMNCVFADGARSTMNRIQLANVPHIVENNKKMTGTSVQYLFFEGDAESSQENVED